MNLQPAVLWPGDKVFLTPEGYKFFYVNGCAKTIQNAQILLSKLTIERIDIARGAIKLMGLDKVCGVAHVVKQLEPGPTDNPTITVIPDLTYNGGNALDLTTHVVKVVQPIVIGRMPMGTKGGNSTVFIVLEHPKTGETVIAETTMKLFLESADRLRAFDDPKGN